MSDLKLREREIIGTSVSITDYDEVLEVIEAVIDTRERIVICCAPASTLINARDNVELRAALAGADIVTPDGMGVVYAARLLGEQIDDRVYGPDLMEMSLERVAAAGQSVWLYGGSDDDALAQLRGALTAKHPGLLIAGSHSPPHRELTADESDAVVQRINADQPDIVWVGLGSPKQELWMHALRDRLDAPVLCGVGAAFDFHADRVSQAPDWMQNRGLEWLFRILQEPGRLGKRYLTTLPRFAALVLLQRLRG